MGEVERKSKDAHNRPQTPHDFTLLKAVRYEDTADGIPPLPVTSINQWQPPSSSNSLEQSGGKRPRTAPSPRSRTPTHAPSDIKRDSGIAPSLFTTDRASYAESHVSSTATGAAKEPSLPTIIVQDDEPPAAVERSRSPFANKRPKDKQAQPTPGSVPEGIERIKSFKGIQSDIPSGSFGDIDLEDLATDRVDFSNRGSLMFGGKKMTKVGESQGDGEAQTDGTSQSVKGDWHEEPKEESLPDGNAPRKGGLVPGRRKPSVHMLQAALQGGRVLSAEEMTFSMRVRSMYEHGDERAAEWVYPVQNGSIKKEAAESIAADRSTPEPSIDSVVVGKTRKSQNDEPSTTRSPTSNARASYYREPNELAGGIEDWGDVAGQEVDRYGFIVPKRDFSRPSTGSQAPNDKPHPGIQRVATALRIEGDQPRRNRKLRRGPSSAKRSSRSMPPRASKDDSVRVASVHSATSHKSIGPLYSGNPFRSREKRTLADASDMLTLPPGLADIAEQEDGGRTASVLKRREWAREEKWQKMARAQPQREHSRSKGKGGGMHFEFDTSDQKLVNRAWKGIPDRWRATAWHSFLSTSAKKRGIGSSDDNLVVHFHKMQEGSSADDVQIDVDVPRTINMHIMFRRRYRGGQRLLFRVLHAISLYFPETGYVQGMASLAATLLCYFDEERAFVMMVRLWQLRGLEKLFQSGFSGLMSALNEFERDWLGGGDVAQKLDELGITSTAYGTRWYLTLFNMSIPFPAQLRVWDVFMLLGDAPGNAGEFGGADLDVLHATSAALIDATREIILDSDFENAMKVLTSFVPIKDEDLLMRVARAEWKLRKKRGASKS